MPPSCMNSMIAMLHALDHRCIHSGGSRVVLDQRAADHELVLHVALACDVRGNTLVDPVALAQVDAVGAFGLGPIDLPSRMGCRLQRLWRAGDLRGLLQKRLVHRLRDACRRCCCFRCRCRRSLSLRCRCRPSCPPPCSWPRNLDWRGLLVL